MSSSPPWPGPALWFQTNIVQTIINSLSIFKDFGQHSRWISPDNIDYYKSRRTVSISKSSSGSPTHFQFQSANTGSTLTSHEVPHGDCYITDSGRDRQQAVKNTVGRHRTLGPAQSSMTSCWFPLQEYFCATALNWRFLSIQNVWHFIYRPFIINDDSKVHIDLKIHKFVLNRLYS